MLCALIVLSVPGQYARLYFPLFLFSVCGHKWFRGFFVCFQEQVWDPWQIGKASKIFRQGFPATALECWLLTVIISELLSSCLFPVDSSFLEQERGFCNTGTTNFPSSPPLVYGNFTMWYLKAEWHSLNCSKLIFVMVLVFQITFAMEKTDAILDWKMRLSTVPSNWVWVVQPEGLGASGMLAVKRWHAAKCFYSLQNPSLFWFALSWLRMGKHYCCSTKHTSVKP